MAKQYFEQKNLVTLIAADHEVLGCESRDHITGTLSWYKILPLSGFNLIRAEQKLLRKWQGVLSKFLGLHPKRLKKTVYDCFLESHESTRQRVESSQPKKHEDHIAGKGLTSMSHHSLVHKFNLMPQVMEFPDAKAAADTEWKKFETIPAWDLNKSRAKRRSSWKQKERKMK